MSPFLSNQMFLSSLIVMLGLINCVFCETNSNQYNNTALDYSRIPFADYESFIRTLMKPGIPGALCRKSVLTYARECYDKHEQKSNTKEDFCTSNCDIVNCLEGVFERNCADIALKVYHDNRGALYISIGDEKCLDGYEVCNLSSFFTTALGIGITIVCVTGLVALLCLFGACAGYRYRKRQDKRETCQNCEKY